MRNVKNLNYRSTAGNVSDPNATYFSSSNVLRIYFFFRSSVLTSHAIVVEPFTEFIANDESHRFGIFQLLQSENRKHE